MATRRHHEGSLRPSRFELSSVFLALAISAMIHGGGYGVYRVGKYFHVWENLHLPSWLAKTRILTSPPEKTRTPDPELELTFVSVNPQTATVDAPANAKYYSDKNSQAANPTVDPENHQPKIDGKQTDIARAEDVPRSPFDKLQPAFPRAEQEQPEQQAKPKTSAAPGDLAMAKPDSNPRPDHGTAEQARPRTIKEALMRQNRNQLAGQKMKEDGGVSRYKMDPGFDVKASPFGAYDAAFIEAVEQRWFALLDNMSYDGYRRGKVVVQFRLNYDGRITDIKIVENAVGETLGLLCWKAISDPAPYDHWPRDMRLLVDKDFREIQFAFFYN